MLFLVALGWAEDPSVSDLMRQRAEAEAKLAATQAEVERLDSEINRVSGKTLRYSVVSTLPLNPYLERLLRVQNPLGCMTNLASWAPITGSFVIDEVGDVTGLQVTNARNDLPFTVAACVEERLAELSTDERFQDEVARSTKITFVYE